MAQQIDIQLTQDSQNTFDIGFASNGDFDMVEGFDTSLRMSIFAERRASESEVPDAIRRRGWIGNTLSDIPDFEIGSKIWLYEQARLTNDTLNGVLDAARTATQWLIDDGLAINIEASIAGSTSEGTIDLKMTIFADSSRVEERFFTLWERTGI